MKIGLCTDSNAQLPPELIERYDVAVVPLTVTIDGRDFLEGVDLNADEFYDRYSQGRTPTVATSQPSPGQFALAYDELVDQGCTQILSVHVASSLSGTLNAARLAARSVPIPVRLVDSGTASFGVACSVWAAGEAILAGASFDQAACVAESLAPRIGNVFVLGAFDLMHAGALAAGLPRGDGVPILTFSDGQVQVVEQVSTMAEAVDSMAGRAIAWGGRLRAAVGVADRGAAPLSEALADALGQAENVVEVVRYRVGPSIGALTGPGTVKCFVFPSE
jgi:DegV family protein with EDD domain